jgi:polysaccharide export outer membrane protein
MNRLLRNVCALLYASACYAAQTSQPAQKVVPSSTTPAPPQSGPTSVTAAPQDTKSAASGLQDGNSAASADPATIKPGCEVEKLPTPESSSTKAYVIGALDVLGVQVWKDPNLSGTFDVGPDGMISLPLLGQIKADGLTQAELTRTIRNRLASSVFECPPDVNVQVLRVNSKKFYILGGVLRPGEFPLYSEITVMEAFAYCGGFKDFANTKKIYIMRGAQKFPFNYKDVSKGRNMAQDIKLQNGDRIYVPE